MKFEIANGKIIETTGQKVEKALALVTDKQEEFVELMNKLPEFHQAVTLTRSNPAEFLETHHGGISQLDKKKDYNLLIDLYFNGLIRWTDQYANGGEWIHQKGVVAGNGLVIGLYRDYDKYYEETRNLEVYI